MFFFYFLLFLVIQRIVELLIAKRNEIWLKERGALEFGQTHYKFIVLVHSLFFLVYFLEVEAFQKEPSKIWPYLSGLFLLTQMGRIWALMSLGRHWNTKILVLPNGGIQKRGPYKFLKHPNYFIVVLEFMIVPLLFQAYITALLFTFLNALILLIRIPAEEKALKELTEYESIFLNLNRFIPNILKKV